MGHSVAILPVQPGVIFAALPETHEFRFGDCRRCRPRGRTSGHSIAKFPATLSFNRSGLSDGAR